jgi:hypothetical protein
MQHDTVKQTHKDFSDPTIALYRRPHCTMQYVNVLTSTPTGYNKHTTRIILLKFQIIYKMYRFLLQLGAPESGFTWLTCQALCKPCVGNNHLNYINWLQSEKNIFLTKTFTEVASIRIFIIIVSLLTVYFNLMCTQSRLNSVYSLSQPHCFWVTCLL